MGGESSECILPPQDNYEPVIYAAGGKGKYSPRMYSGKVFLVEAEKF